MGALLHWIGSEEVTWTLRCQHILQSLWYFMVRGGDPNHCCACQASYVPHFEHLKSSAVFHMDWYEELPLTIMDKTKITI